jgi:type II secretory pathway pseudopilin PulG
MKKRDGFSLVELTAATLISSFIAVSLATIFATANRQLFQNFRGNTIKADVSIGMHAIRNAMAIATRLDEPAINTTGSRLATASNVDQLTGCYPISDLDEARWSLFCTATTDGNTRLYYYSGTYPADSSCACPNDCATTNPAANIATCGSGGGTVLAQFLNTEQVFSRSWSMTDIPPDDFLPVRVKLRAIWNPPTGLASTQRKEDYSLDSTFSVSRSLN